MRYNPKPIERLLTRFIARKTSDIVALLNKAVNDVAGLTDRLAHPAQGEDFYFRNYPTLSHGVDSILRSVSAQITDSIQSGSQWAWDLADVKNDRLLESVVRAIGAGRIPAGAAARWAQRNLEALASFQDRKQGGLGLSQRVWQYTGAMKGDLELALDLGLGDGKSADALSRAVRRYLREPDRLYRRVRDEKGILRLSRSASNYHPGQGTYRSAYKNARRLTATEINMAYRTSDYTRIQDIDFILGIEVHLSNNHTCLDSHGIPRPFYDICDELEGRYPKDFKFVGWHPHCRCYTTTILPSKDEFFDYLAEMDESGHSTYQFKGYVEDVPPQFKEWEADNADRIERAMERGTLPYFLRDNSNYWGNTRATTPPSPVAAEQPESILDRAARRHAARTPEQEKDIRDRWAARIKTGFAPEWDMDKKYPHELDRMVALEKYIGDAFKTNAYKDSVIRSLRWNRSVDKFFAEADGWGKRIAPMLPLGSQYNAIARADLSMVAPVWRSRYTELIGELNAGKDLCLWDKRSAIGEAHNILKLSELAEKGLISVADYSTKTPYNWLTEFKSEITHAKLPKKAFFDTLPGYVPLQVTKDFSGAHHLPDFEYVEIGLGPKIKWRFKSPYYAESLFYHEFGHAQYDMLGVEGKKEFQKVYNAFRLRMNRDGGIGYREKLWQINKAMRSSEYLEDLLSPQNAELLGSYSDAVQAVSSSHDKIGPRCHPKSYFGDKHHRMTEIYAHMSENLWAGNKYFEAFDKKTYDEFMVFIKTLLGVE